MPTARTLPPVAKLPADLAPRLWTLFAQTLEPLGFTPKSNYRLFYYWTRQTETLEQRCGLAFTDDTVATWFDYRFTSSLVSWAPVDDALALRTVERFQSLNREFARLRKVGVESDRVVAKQTYFASLDSAGPENAFARSEAPSLLSLAVETFESRREALAVLRDFDAGRFDATSSPYSFPPLIWNGAPCFGSDPIHNALTLAGLRFQTGQNAEALAQFDALAALLRDLSSPDAARRFHELFDEFAPLATPLAPSYWNAAFELALLGVDVAKRRIAVDGPGPSAPKQPEPIEPSPFTKSRRFKRPAFSTPGLDETLVFTLLKTARFSDDEAKAAEAIRRLEELATQASFVVYEAPDECRLVKNDATSTAPTPSPAPLIDDAASSSVPSRSRSRRRQVAPPVPLDPVELVDEKTALAALKTNLTRRLGEIFAQRFEPLGFKKKTAQCWTQTTQTLSRYCRFVFSPHSLFVVFGYSVLPQFDCWANAPQDAESQELIVRFRKKKPEFPGRFKYDLEPCADEAAFYSDGRVWAYPPNDGETEILVAQADAFIADVVSFFERFPEIDDLLREYDAGLIPQKFALGQFAGPRREFYAAQTRFRAGQYAESLARFEAVPELLRLFDETPPNASTRLLLEVARLGALSVRQTIAERGPGSAALSTAPLPEPLATALPFAPSHQARNLRQKQELASSSFEPETTVPRAAVAKSADKLRRLQEKCAQVLEPLGFTRTSPICWTRESATIRQTFNLDAFFDSLSLDFAASLKLDFSPWDAAPQDEETQGVIERWRAFAAKRWPDGAFPNSEDGYWRLNWATPITYTPPSDDVVRRTVTREQIREDVRGRFLPPSKRTPTSFDETLNKVDKGFKETVVPFFNYWRTSRDVLDAPRPSYQKSGFSTRPGVSDEAADKLCLAIALFQAGRYTESSKRFDALSKLKKKPYAQQEYAAADWATLQDAARIAAECVRQIAQNQKLKR